VINVVEVYVSALRHKIDKPYGRAASRLSEVSAIAYALTAWPGNAAWRGRPNRLGYS
jgi:hypothetical protein